jgi:hypothetical protein
MDLLFLLFYLYVHSSILEQRLCISKPYTVDVGNFEQITGEKSVENQIKCEREENQGKDDLFF